MNGEAREKDRAKKVRAIIHAYLPFLMALPERPPKE
jgi:hypothetical protein